jgi:hypothetical protein
MVSGFAGQGGGPAEHDPLREAGSMPLKVELVVLNGLV